MGIYPKCGRARVYKVVPSLTHMYTTRVSDARVAGMLSGKAGIVHVHVGKGGEGLKVAFPSIFVLATWACITLCVKLHFCKNRPCTEDGW